MIEEKSLSLARMKTLTKEADHRLWKTDPPMSVVKAYDIVQEAAKGIGGLKEQEAQAKIFSVMNSLPKDVAKKVVRKFKREMKVENREIRRKRHALVQENQSLNDHIKNLTKSTEIIVELKKWNSNLVLQRPVGCATHRLFEALYAGKVYAAAKACFMDSLTPGTAIPQIFVVEHNWSGAFSKAEMPEGEFQLPYDDACFEFMISGKRVCAMIGDDKLGIYVEHNKEWVVPHNMYTYGSKGWKPDEHENAPKIADEFGNLLTLVTKEIRSICIALEAEVAGTDIVRAPHKLNHEREKSGKLPLYDYHVIKLAHRTRAAPFPDDHVPSERKRQRMHFVRGHWKHYANHKTWTKWFLKGDPDLGFIDKEYRL